MLCCLDNPRDKGGLLSDGLQESDERASRGETKWGEKKKRAAG
jgi:hypothetical protein